MACGELPLHLHFLLGLWTHGTNLHYYTEDHPKAPDSSPPVAVAAVAAAEANLGFLEAPFHFGFLGFIAGPESSAFMDGVDFSPSILSPDEDAGADDDVADEEEDDLVLLVHPKGPGGKMTA